ncbi:MAG: hypothetical protein IPM39_24625 [Chloroflexi bacterium]|nr:hypothetical protein [Chloroflexota bacterium]
MHETAVYRICIQGALDETWTRWLGADLRVQVHHDDPESTTTTLTGKISDQAALIGLLSSLYNVNLPLLAVERLEAAETMRS